MKPKRKVTAKQKIFGIICILAVPFFVVILLFQVNAVRQVNENLRDTGEEYVDTYQDMMVSEIGMIQKYIEEIISNNSHFQKLAYSKSDTEAYVNLKEVAKELNIMQWSQNAGGGYIIYDQDSSMIREVYLYYSDYKFADKEGFRDYMRQRVESGEWNAPWNVQNINGNNYLLRIFGKQKVYIMGIYDLQILLEGQKTEEGSSLFLADIDGNILAGNEAMGTGNLRIEKEADNLPVKFIYDMPNSGIHTLLYSYSLEMLLIIACMISFFWFGFNRMEKQYLGPFRKLIETMKKVTDGNEEAKMEDDSDIIEFHELTQVFNDMLGEVKTQKMASYESRIEAQNMKIQYYQAQIKPHFLQNCLTNMYALAECKKNEELQKMILAFSRYLQYAARDNAVICSIDDELHNVENYIVLQQMIASCPVDCRIEAEERVRQYGIFPLSILTFAENSIKHRKSKDQEVKIEIKITEWKNEEEDCLEVMILDNGEGFPDQWLARLNKPEENAVEEGEHIGIRNVKRRFQLAYGEKSAFLFSNIPGNGACIQFFFPAIEMEQHKRSQEVLE